MVRIFHTLFPIVCVAAAHAATPAAAEQRAAAEFVQATASRVFNSFSDDITDRQREDRFRHILNDSFDLETISRFTLGRYWRLASPAVREEYRGLFEKFLVRTYSKHLRDLDGVRFRLVRSRPINERDYLVGSSVLDGSRRVEINVGWRVRKKGEELRIIDLIVEGISMSVAQRDEFSLVIRRNGGKVEGLLAALRSKVDPEAIPGDGSVP